MENTNKKGICAMLLVQAALLLAKLTGLIKWAWFWVLLPLILPVLLILVCVVALYVSLIIFAGLTYRHNTDDYIDVTEDSN